MAGMNVPDEEWAFAHQYLDALPDGTKLPYSAIVNQTGQPLPRCKRPVLFDEYKITHSFIKLNGQIYAIAPGKSFEAIVGTGHFGKVKYIQREDKTVAVIKIETDETQSQQFEAKILQDLSLSSGKVKRIDNSKFYTHLNYLGKTLAEVLNTENDSLSEAFRLEIAIDLCLQVANLHRGVNSKTKTPYAHLDIKLRNATLDQSNRVHLIDFGFSEAFPEKINTRFRGTPLYQPLETSHDKGLTRVQYDLLALKRTLFMPTNLYCARGFVDTTTDSRLKIQHSILNQGILNRLNLNQYINTHCAKKFNPEVAVDFSEDTTSVLALAAILICANHDITIDYELIKSEERLALFITSFYTHGKVQEIQSNLENYSKVNLIAALVELQKFDQFEHYLKDDKLMTTLANVLTHAQSCALVILNDRNIDIQYQLVESAIIANAICLLEKKNLGQHIPSIVINEDLAKACLILNCYEQLSCFENLLNAPQLYSYIAANEQSELVRVIIILLTAGYDEADILVIANSEMVLQAILLLEKFKLKDLLHELIESIELAQALVHCINHIQLSDLYLKSFIESKAHCIALNCLVKAEFSKDQLYPLRSAKPSSTRDLAQAICFLEKHNLPQFYEKALQDIKFVRLIKLISTQANDNEMVANQLNAYVTLLRADIDIQTALSDTTIQGINRLTQHGVQDPEYFKKIVSQSLFAPFLLQADKGYQVNAVIKLANYDLLKIPIPTAFYRLSNMFNAAKNEQECILFLKFFTVLQQLEIKKRQFKHSDVPAYVATKKLLKKIRKLVDKSFSIEQETPITNASMREFCQSCSELISQKRDTFEHHRGALGMLDTCLTVLASLIVLYPFVYAYQKINHINYSFFKTNTAVISEEISHTLQEIAACA